MIITGAVNGQATVADVNTSGTLVTIPFFPSGTETTLDVSTDGSGLHGVNHRVACICGDTASRDHFPFPVVDFTTDPNNSFPIELTLDQMLATFWRVRKWRVHGNLANSRGSMSTSFDWTATMGDDIERPVGSQASNVTEENQLVLAPVIDSTEALDTEDGGGYELDMFGLTSAITFTDPNFRPAFLFRVFTSAGIDSFLSSDFAADGPATSVTCNFSVGGTNIPFTLYKEAAETGDITGSVTIEPLEYWPYATKDGDAVYDTGDGTQLLDPLS